MIDDTELIVGALRMPAPKPRKKKIIQEIEPCSLDADENDPVWRLAKLCSNKKQKTKSINQWTSSDFIKHFSAAINTRGIHLDIAIVRDREVMNKLYDTFVKCLDDKMSNSVFRDYIDWWVSVYAQSLADKKININMLTNESSLGKFMKRFKSESNSAIAWKQNEQKEVVVDDETLYKMGGLQMLVVSRGIVVAARMLRKYNLPDWIIQISSALQKTSKETVCGIIETTLRNGPYPRLEMFDFVSVARPALQYYGIKLYDSTKYQESFK